MKNLLSKTPISISSSNIIQTHKNKISKSTSKLKSQKTKHQLSIKPIIVNQNNKILNSFSPKKKYLLPPKKTNKKTLVLDLDETLVHSCFIPFNIPSDLIIQIELENKIQEIYVLIRPYVKEFLESMSKLYEIVVFTASISKYANALLNIIDNKKYCIFRLFREHCTLINSTFIKDLSLLGRDMKDIIIVDNSPIVYSLNQYNGFPIESWFNDKNDNELLKIIPILEFLSYVPDVREYIKKIVSENKIKFDIVGKVINNYNNKLKNYFMPLSMRNHLNFKKNINDIEKIFLNKSSSIKFNSFKIIYCDSSKKINYEDKKLKFRKNTLTHMSKNNIFNTNTMKYNNSSLKKIYIVNNRENIFNTDSNENINSLNNRIQKKKINLDNYVLKNRLDKNIINMN